MYLCVRNKIKGDKKCYHPLELLNKIKDTAKLEKTEKTDVIKFNKAGKIKFQLLALDSDYLFKSRTQHFIPTIPNEEDKNEKMLVSDCIGYGCPICEASTDFRKKWNYC